MVDEKKEKVRDKLIEDCFGNVAGRLHCHILTEDMCLYGKCPFYKTRAQFDADRVKYGGSAGVGAGKHYLRRRVRCVDTGKIYPSVTAAIADTGISESAIYNVLNGKQKATHGMRFEYL